MTPEELAFWRLAWVLYGVIGLAVGIGMVGPMVVMMIRAVMRVRELRKRGRTGIIMFPGIVRDVTPPDPSLFRVSRSEG